LSWLLTQEAQNAAERLRVGVQFLRTQAPPPIALGDDPAQGVENSLDALDDVMRMLSNLNQRATPQSGSLPAARRGRIDVAALLVEVAPDARVSIEPGSGTEVYGDEADLRRMLQVLVGHGSGEGASVTVRRDGDDVKVAVSLGPDSSPTAETERAWLSRVVMRFGGRHELEGGSEVLIFPADGASERSESAALRKELDEARRQGEAYARELAAIFDRGEELAAVSSVPPGPGVLPSDARLVAMTKICAAVASELRNALGPAARELAAMRRHEITDEQLDTIRRRVAHTQEVVQSLSTIGEIRAGELDTEIDLAEVVRETVRSLTNVAERDDVKVIVRVSPENARVYVRRGAKAVGVLVRELIAHAIEASPRGSSVDVTVATDIGNAAVRLIVDDAGPALPASGRRAFLALERHAGAYGRPSGLPIFLAAELAACQGAILELSDVPIKSQGDASNGGPGGLRVTVTFAKT
jgi:hypothetical protein